MSIFSPLHHVLYPFLSVSLPHSHILSPAGFKPSLLCQCYLITQSRSLKSVVVVQHELSVTPSGGVTWMLLGPMEVVSLSFALSSRALR